MKKFTALMSFVIATCFIFAIVSETYAFSNRTKIGKARRVKANAAIAKLDDCIAWFTDMATKTAVFRDWATDHRDGLALWVRELPDDQFHPDMSTKKSQNWRAGKNKISPVIKQYKSKCAGITKAIKAIK